MRVAGGQRVPIDVKACPPGPFPSLQARNKMSGQQGDCTLKFDRDTSTFIDEAEEDAEEEQLRRAAEESAAAASGGAGGKS